LSEKISTAGIDDSEGVEAEEDEGFASDSCFGEYGEWQHCPHCGVKDKCKRFTEAEKKVAIRQKGKYSGRGKEIRRDSY